MREVEGALLPEEARTVGPVSDARRRELARERACARLTMQKLGVGPLPLLWPAALFGCITHCDGYYAAVVARTRDLRAIGIDAEPMRAFGDVVLDRIALAGERAWISGADAQAPLAVVLFSAKESVFKAWFQVFESALDFSTCASTLIRLAGHSLRSSSATSAANPAPCRSLGDTASIASGC
jgi:4'-phosphopantetheinyl transferase EntD